MDEKKKMLLYWKFEEQNKHVRNYIKQNILIVLGQGRIRWQLAEKKALSNGVLAFLISGESQDSVH